jgi:hypothetical protein
MEPGQQWVILVIIGMAIIVPALGFGLKMLGSAANRKFNSFCEKRGWKVTDKK